MDSQRVTTDSEEELLTQILLTMSRSLPDQSHPRREDESDYANLWDSESGPTASAPSNNKTAFQANKDVMGSLLRTKVSGQLSQDSERRKAWINYSDSTGSSSQTEMAEAGSMNPFNMDKFESLKDKANNLDLTLTDFFSDLKHSNSFLELSKLFSSTSNVAPNGKHR